MVLVLLAAAALARPAPKPQPSLEDVAGRLVGAALEGHEAWDILEHLCDDVGHRLAGSPQLDAAVKWGVERMKQELVKALQA